MKFTIAILTLLAAAHGDDWTSKDPAARRKAAESAAIKDIPILIDALSDDDAKVRAAVRKRLAALGRERLPEYVNFLGAKSNPAKALFLKITNLFLQMGAAVTPADAHDAIGWGSPGSAAIAACLYASASIPDHDVTPDVLVEALGDHDENTVRMAGTVLALQGWFAADSERATDAEVKDLVALLDSTLESVASTTVILLGMIGPRSCVPAVRTAEPWAVTTIALVRLGAPPAPPGKRELRSIDTIVATLQKNPRYIDGLLLDLNRMDQKGASAAVPHLWKRLKSGETPMPVRVAETLLKIAPDDTAKIVAWLAGTIDNPRKPWLRMGAIDLLAKIGQKARPAVPALVRVLSVPEKPNRGTLAQQSAQLGAGFRAGLRSKRRAADLLGALRAKEAKDALQPLLKHGDARLRYRAARALRRMP